jgi:hypothetical protein
MARLTAAKGLEGRVSGTGGTTRPGNRRDGPTSSSCKRLAMRWPLPKCYKASIQLRAAEDRIAQFQGEVERLQCCTNRAERRLGTIKKEIEDKPIAPMEPMGSRLAPEIEPPRNAVLAFGSVQHVTRGQQRGEFGPTIGRVEPARLRPLRIGQKNCGRWIGLECGHEVLSNGISGKQKRKPLDVRRRLPHPGARHGEERAVVSHPATAGFLVPVHGRSGVQRRVSSCLVERRLGGNVSGVLNRRVIRGGTVSPRPRLKC